MKKVITILMLMCITLCACSKEEPKTETTTPDVTETPVVEEHCEKCNKKAVLKEFKYGKQYFYVCDDCYTELDENITGCENYNAIVAAANIASTYEKVTDEVKELGDGYITIDKNGVTLENIGNETKKAMLNCLPDLMDFRSPSKGVVKISFSKATSYIMVTREETPTNLIETMK